MSQEFRTANYHGKRSSYRMGRERILKTDVVRESAPYLNYSMFSYGQPQPNNHTVLNMINRPGMRIIRDVKPIAIPDVSEVVPAPLLAPNPIMPQTHSYGIPQAPPYVPREPPMTSQTPANVEEIKDSLSIIDENIDNMPIEDVMKINDKLEEGVQLNKSEEKLIAPANSSLLEDIRRGIQLKKASEIEKPKESGFSLQEALKKGLAKQRKGVEGGAIYIGGNMYNRKQLEQADRINKYMNYVNKFY